MNFYCFEIQYKGTNFSGWQIQKNQKTIQGEFNKALAKISKTDSIKSVGSGRTDAGVHALAQVVRAETPLEIDPGNLMKAMNSLLPKTIVVNNCYLVEDTFHPIFSAKSKTYEYLFSLDEVPVHFRDLVTSYAYPLDIEIMKEGAKIFEGEHDFCNYFTTGTPVSTTVRKINSCQLEWRAYSSPWSQDWSGAWCLKINGSGFLKQMVRLMMGTLWNLGRGSLTLSELEESLSKKLDKKPGIVAPAEGLYLHSVDY